MSTFTHPRRPPSVAGEVARLFAAQYGLVTPAQLRSAGVSRQLQRVRVERGEWADAWPGVIRLCGTPDDWRQPLMAATLSSRRTAITAGSALRVHAVDGFGDFADVYAIAGFGDRPRLADDVHLWRSRRLTDEDTMTVDGIRVTTLATALVHAAAVHDRDLVGRAVDDALRRPISPIWLQSTADRWGGHGVPGSGIVSAMLAERCDRRLPRSWFERVARKALSELGIHLEHEVEVHDGRQRIAVLDLADVRWKVGVECQSWEWHATPAAQRADDRRKRRLTRLGWAIIELWWSDLRHLEPVVEEIRDAFDRQRRLLGVVSI